MTREEFLAYLRVVVQYPNLHVDVYRLTGGEWWVYVSSGDSHLKSYIAAVDTQEEALEIKERVMNDENVIAYVYLSLSDMLAVPVGKLPALVALLQDTVQIRREWKEPYEGRLVVVHDRGHTTMGCMTEAEMVMAKVIGKKLFKEQES